MEAKLRALNQATGRNAHERGTISKRSVARVPPSSAPAVAPTLVRSSVTRHVYDSMGPPRMRRCTPKVFWCDHSKGISS